MEMVVEAVVVQAQRTLIQSLPVEPELPVRATPEEMKQRLGGEVQVVAVRVRQVAMRACMLPERVEVVCGIPYPVSILHMQAVVAVVRMIMVQSVRAEQVVVVRAAKAPMEPMAHQTQAAAAAAVILRRTTAGTEVRVS